MFSGLEVASVVEPPRFAETDVTEHEDAGKKNCGGDPYFNGDLRAE
jgi:hypothetical protein